MGKINKVLYKKHFPLIKVLNSLDKESRSIVLNHLDDASSDLISECIFNVIHKPDRLPKETRSGLKRVSPKEKQSLRYVADPRWRDYRDKRRAALSQSGKGLGLILSALVPILTSLLFPK